VTAAELIEALKAAPPEAEVVTWAGEPFVVGSIDNDEDGWFVILEARARP
jgi:hypothetical protein